MQISGKHVVIAGGAKRIGLELARRLLAEGAYVSVLFRTESQDLIDLKNQYPQHVLTVPFNLSECSSLSKAVAELVQWKPKVTAHFSVASSFYPTPLSQVTEDQWDDLFDTNVKGHFFLIQSLLPAFDSPSCIINLVDIFASTPLKGYSPYVSAKGAFLTLSRNLAKELAPRTRVNSISPGAVLLPEHFTPEESAQHARRNLFGRLGSPADIVNAALFLLENDYITGLDLRVDGGASLL